MTLNAPANAGSEYFNYKATHSIVLMAISDANYKIIYTDIGSRGRNSDGGVFATCSFTRKLGENTLNIPPARPLPLRQKPMPFYLLADDAFPIKENIMKPFSHRNADITERIFNYRLSRARRVIENAFGILSARFRILRKNIEIHAEKAVYIVAAACVLHNFLLSRNSHRLYAPPNFIDRELENGEVVPGEWRRIIDQTNNEPNVQLNAGRIHQHVLANRDELKEYFMNEGAVGFQYNYV